MCALRLAGRLRRKPVKIALINPQRQFVERLRPHENLGVAHSTTLRTFDLKALLATLGVTFIEGEVTAIDRLDWCVSVRDNDKQVLQIGCERLVIAVGSRSNTNLIPGQHKNSYIMDASAKNGPEALRLAVKKASSSNIAIIGGGATGVEIAAELALRAGTKITLIDRGILGNFVLPNVAKHIRKRLAQFGVVLLENTHISEVTKNKLIINSPKRSKEIPFDICVSATGFCVSDLPANAELPIGVNGRILADSALRSIADERI
ncbi:MAG: FAD-dependent oxidoreductase [Rhizobiaceae bacterium]|nr:FAD-dependent oxidoreductase [Rhizobiaceae bacterium]